MLNDEIANIASQRVTLEIDTQHQRIGTEIEKIRRSWAARGLSRGSSGMVFEIAQLCSQAARERGKVAWDAIESTLRSAGIEYSNALTSDLKAFADKCVYFRDLKGYIETEARNLVNAAGIAELNQEVETGVQAARSRIQSDIELYGLELKGRAAPSTSREKHQKFGILDAPNLFSKDLENSHGIFGRAAIYLDLDDFKSINARFTETVVDRIVLPPIHKQISALVENLGFAYGEGGDEFKVFLPNATLRIALEVAEEIRLAIQRLKFAGDAETLQVTASLGVAHASHDQVANDIAVRANQAKQQAKQNGKNCIFIWNTAGCSKFRWIE